jgi:hypothetical protein
LCGELRVLLLTCAGGEARYFDELPLFKLGFLKLIEQVSQLAAGPVKSAKMTSKSGKMQPIPLSPLFDGGRL